MSHIGPLCVRAWPRPITADPMTLALAKANVDIAADYAGGVLARQWEASQAWWVEAAQQVRDVRRGVTEL